jgi:hypothetical protein
MKANKNAKKIRVAAIHGGFYQPESCQTDPFFDIKMLLHFNILQRVLFYRISTGAFRG